MINLGDRVKDTITGFQGVAVGITVWLYGCKRIGIQGTELKDGKVLDPEWFDEQRLISLDDKTHKSSVRVGGPQHDPRR